MLANDSVALVEGKLTVDPAPLTVTADDARRFTGDPDPVFTGAISPTRNADVSTASYGTTADTTSPVGQYLIVPTLSGPRLSDCAVTVVPGTLDVIRPASLTGVVR